MMGESDRAALVLGATGLVGDNLVTRLLESDKYAEVRLISRREIGHKHKKINAITMPLEEMQQAVTHFAHSDVFCCLGTTQKDAGSKEAFRHVDFDLVVLAAVLAKANAARTFVMLSALGANANSSVFYSRVKGEAELEVMAKGPASVHILRPSLLVGRREKTRKRELLAVPFMELLGLLPGSRGKNLKPISASLVAKAMLKISAKSSPGRFVYESGDIRAVATGSVAL
jgi:uncharacterized protein YbjT (DUF2867 family)